MLVIVSNLFLTNLTSTSLHMQRLLGIAQPRATFSQCLSQMVCQMTNLRFFIWNLESILPNFFFHKHKNFPFFAIKLGHLTVNTFFQKLKKLKLSSKNRRNKKKKVCRIESRWLIQKVTKSWQNSQEIPRFGRLVPKYITLFTYFKRKW